MKSISRALRTARLIAALLPLSVALLAADPSPTPAAETPLHEIGSTSAKPVPPVAPLPAMAPALTAAPAPAPTVAKSDDDDDDDKPVSSHHSHRHDDDDNRVAVGDSIHLASNESIEGNEVAVFGSLWNDGTVEGNAVTVMGASHINGTVHGNAVVVAGSIRLGPNSHVDGNVVSVGGHVVKEPGAYIGGHIVNLGFTTEGEVDNMTSSWWTNGLQMGRPLAIGPHLHALWIFNAFLIGLYIVIALGFPGGIAKCTDTLVHRPGSTFLVGVFSIIALPVLFVLLCVTIVGIPVALIVLPLAVITAILFGKAAIYRLIGSSIIGKGQHTALAVLVGAILFVLIYLVPIVGLMVWIVVAFLGFACVATTLLSPVKAAVAVTTPIAVAVPAMVPVAGTPAAEAVAPAAALAVPGTVESAPMPPLVAPLPVHVPEAALPRARFWPRMLALLIDGILIGVLTHSSRSGDAFLPVLAAYATVFWKFKGSTVGSVIFGHKVVRIDGRPVDWMTAVVRALSCFISFVALGLGFIWIAFDPEKQGWHDKIAGTVVVKLPKGASLV